MACGAKSLEGVKFGMVGHIAAAWVVYKPSFSEAVERRPFSGIP